MDLDGVWRAPEEWPEDYPPIDGWIRGRNGRWSAPDQASDDHEPSYTPPTINTEARQVEPAPKRLSRQARADRRAMYTVAGVIGGAMLLLAAALIVITQAGASDTEQARSDVPDVIFAAETDADRAARHEAAAAAAPAHARESLEQLPVRGAVTGVTGFVEQEWTATVDGCLDRDEMVLVERSETPVTWADQLECVPDGGQWTDPFLGTVLRRTIDAEVIVLVPTSVVFASGGDDWSAATRSSYSSDLRHRATLQIVAAGSGHNPRSQDPSQWRPSSRGAWCAYAVDWISVKAHWGLDIHAAEKAALGEMLESCDDATSAGANPVTAIVDALAPPSIERQSADS